MRRGTKHKPETIADYRQKRKGVPKTPEARKAIAAGVQRYWDNKKLTKAIEETDEKEDFLSGVTPQEQSDEECESCQ